MNNKKRISRWLLALLSTVMVLASLIGCSSREVNEALDTAIEILDVVESVEAEIAEAETALDDDSLIQAESSIQTETSISVETEPAAVTSKHAETDTTADAFVQTENSDIEDEEHLTVEEDGHYTSKEEVALYLHTYGKLPSNFISKKKAEELGWKQKQGEAGQLHVVAPGMSIGGSSFGNYEGLLPEKKGRKYYECDINYKKGNRGAERIVYSNDGLIFYTGDHYETFEQLYPAES